MRLGDRLFVTGTDTGVGKTITAAALCAALAEADVRVAGLKPVASGTPAGEPPEDAVLLGRAARHAPRWQTSFAAPLSPHRAAALEGRSIDLEAVVAWVDAHLGEVTLCEGAGGWEVPLADGVRISDLAVRLGWPVLVVAPNRLGVINHTLLTVEAIARRGLRVAAVVLVEGPPDSGADAARPTNLEDLQALLPGLAVRGMPRVDVADTGALARAGRALLAR